MVFEKKVLRKIFGTTKKRDGTCRIKTNTELDELIRHKDIINHTKALVRPFTTNAGRENVKKLYKWKPMLTRPLGRPKNRWENDIRNDMKKLKIKNWNSGIQDCNKRKLYVENAKTFKD